MPPQITIITPTKNRRQLLARTMDSVRQQSLQEWEHIVVDDGSDDGTEEEVTQRADADPRVRYIRRSGPKAGANVCRNIGIRESRSDLIVLLDSDDLLRPECLKRRADIMRRNPDLDFTVYRAAVFSDAPGDLGRLFHPQPPGDDLLRFLAHECVWEITGPVWRKAFLERIGSFDETLRSMQDLELHVRAICAGGKYVCLPDVDHDISWHFDARKTSVRHMFDPKFFEAAERVWAKLFDDVKSNGLLTWSRQRALLGLCYTAAESWVVHEGRLSKGMLVWNRGCRRHQAPWPVWLSGLVLLCALRVSSKQGGIVERLANKWRGWVRFRQEPSLAELADVNASK
jgi:glycosyltransferase involved in cell wall biosynthesis